MVLTNSMDVRAGAAILSLDASEVAVLHVRMDVRGKWSGPKEILCF